MYKFKQFLQESLNKPYKFKMLKNFSDKTLYEFTDGDGRKFLMEFHGKDDMWSASYGLKIGSSIDYRNTNFGDPFKVLSTVITIMTDFIKEREPGFIKFSGNVLEGKSKLYTKILKHFKPKLQKLGYKAENPTLRDPSTIKFQITRTLI